MSAESLFPPISIEARRAARSRLALEGLTVSQWAAKNGYNVKTVSAVLGGSRVAVRGKALKIAIALGLRPHPDAVQSVLAPKGRAADLAPPAAPAHFHRDSRRKPGGAHLKLGEPAR